MSVTSATTPATDRRSTCYVSRNPTSIRACPPRTNVPLASFENFALRYPDGPRNAEALLVDPGTQDVLIVHKNDAGSGLANVYRTALPRAGTVGTFQHAGTVRLRAGELVTGGEMSPAGDAVVLRTYGRVVVYQRASGHDGRDGAQRTSMRRARPCRTPRRGNRIQRRRPIHLHGERGLRADAPPPRACS